MPPRGTPAIILAMFEKEETNLTWKWYRSLVHFLRDQKAEFHTFQLK